MLSTELVTLVLIPTVTCYSDACTTTIVILCSRCWGAGISPSSTDYWNQVQDDGVTLTSDTGTQHS
jgi:hypothetical protein